MKDKIENHEIIMELFETNRSLSRIAAALEKLAGIDASCASLAPLAKAEQSNLNYEVNSEGDVMPKETPEQLERPLDALTHDDLKAACLAKSREETGNKAKIKALLKSYGAVKAVDVPEDKLCEVIGKINAGDF